MRWLALMVLVAACGNRCPTTCGLTLQGEVWSCPDFQHIEDVSMTAFKAVTDPRFADSCARISGYTVHTYDSQTLYNGIGREDVYGRTYCDDRDDDPLGKLIEIGTNPGTLKSALPHELAHAVQACDPANHLNWDDAGIYRAVSDAEAQLPAAP